MEELHNRINKLTLENQALKEEKRELEELLLKISELSEKQLRGEEEVKGCNMMQYGENHNNETDRRF